MTCNCNISISYYAVIEGSNVEVPTFELTPLPYLYNNQSIYQWLDELLTTSFLLRWDGDNWEIVYEDGEGLVSVLTSTLALICPTEAEVDNNWQDQEGAAIVHVITYRGCPTVQPVCTAWESTPSITIPEPWQTHVITFPDLQDTTVFYLGQGITFLNSNTPLGYSGTGVYYIGSILYTDGTNIFTEQTSGRYFYGIILIDSNGQLIIPGDDNSGYLCVYPNYDSPENITKECFDKLVWDKQCEFSKCVLNYVKLLRFGIAPCDMLEDLMNKRRALEILNCYDTRDIEFNTTDYNTLPYSTIKKLLNT
jgi:hypothetical protein